jgi:hypothetical protein
MVEVRPIDLAIKQVREEKIVPYHTRGAMRGIVHGAIKAQRERERVGVLTEKYFYFIYMGALNTLTLPLTVALDGIYNIPAIAMKILVEPIYVAKEFCEFFSPRSLSQKTQ